MSRSLLAASLLLGLGSVHAATFTVTRLDDVTPDGCASNGCTLREAVLAANAAHGADAVVLGSGAHVLRQPSLSAPVTLTVSGDTAFTGAGRDLTNIQSQGRGSLFFVRDSTVSFSGVTLKNAQSTGTDFGGLGGGAIRADNSVLSLVKMRLSGSSATDGGALHLTDTSLDAASTLIESHKAGRHGGGIWAQNSPIRLRAGTVLRWNTADNLGGAVASDDEVVADDDCLVSGNFAHFGGGIAARGSALTVRGVVTAGGDGLFEISGNTATGLDPFYQVPTGQGGGIQSGWGVSIERVALLDNISDDSAGGFYSTGGSPFSLRDSYVAGNEAEHGAGGGLVASPYPLVIERVGFNGNRANHTGALSIVSGTPYGQTPATATLRNVDFHGNVADVGAGALSNAMTAVLTNVTFWNNTDVDGRAAIILYGDFSSITYANSVMLGRCVGDPARIVAAGRNLRSSENANACTGSFSLNPHFLSRGTYGGLFEISGTSNANSATVNAGADAHCSTVDIRNRTRGLPCDLGVYEFGTH